jgi:signal-transduction protein with cAMP-binding, CBS, and nucleotidyltransferase domain
VGDDASAEDATRLMLSRRIHHLPVVHDGRLIGMVELSDLCRPLLGAPRSSPQVAPDDGSPRFRSLRM